MDKKRNKKWIGIVSVALICICIVIIGNHLSKSSEAVVVASDGKTVIAHLYWKDKKIQYECTEGCEDYVDLACREAIEALRKMDNLSKEEARKKLVREEYTLVTYFEEDIFKALEKGDKAITSSSGEALTLSDGKGHLLAAYTSGNNSSVNQLLKKTYAGSTMKPLSTYGLGIEKNVISWSSLYKDSAYEEDWPTNVEAFTGQEETVAEALAESNNSITVKVLDDIGIEEACTFMQESLELQVDEEKKMLEEDAELYKKELLSSLGLGYLTEGVNVKEMLENYQVFAQDGEKYKLASLKIIKNKENDIIYENKESKNRIFSSQTAYIMNRMLKGVVQSGTGKAAQINGIDVCGKTGTSDNYRDNWFIGMTPEYVCAIWYGLKNGERMQNDAVVAFQETINQLPVNQKTSYPIPEAVVEREYCEKTGLLAGEHCENIQTGYYKENELPTVCGE